MSNFAEILNNLLKKKQMSWFALAQKIGVSPAAVSKYKAGRIPRAEVLKKIADLFGVSMEYLITGQGFEPAAVEQQEPELVKRGLYDFSIRLRQALDKKQMTATRLAAKIGVSRAVVSNWLRARNYPNNDAIKKAAAVLGVSKDYLITGGEIERHETIFMEPARSSRGKRTVQAAPEKQDTGETVAQADQATLASSAATKFTTQDFEQMTSDLKSNPDLAQLILEFYKFQKEKLRQGQLRPRGKSNRG